MRPDPYKRARSRQYKANHGIFDSKKFQSSETNLPNNISEEQLFVLSQISDEQNEDSCLILDDDSFVTELKNSSISEKYKYPKNLYKEIFGCALTSANDSITSHSPYLALKLSLPERFFSENECVLNLQNNSSTTANNLKSTNLLELHEETKESNTTASPVMKKSIEGKVALEDWLDEVL